MREIRAVECKIIMVPPQRELLDKTFIAFADACNYIRKYGQAYCKSQQRELHEACYLSVREKFGLPSSLTIRAIARVAADLYTTPATPAYKPTILMFDSRSFLLDIHDWSLKLTLLDCREKFHLDIGNRQQQLLKTGMPTGVVLHKKYKSCFAQIRMVEQTVTNLPSSTGNTHLGGTLAL